MFGIFAGMKIPFGKQTVLRMRSKNLIDLSDDNRNCSSFFVRIRNIQTNRK
jgi:hypothetical protein